MAGDYDPTLYYVSISALQKSVRRGEMTNAVKFARIAWELDNWRLYARLYTILYEDCGYDINGSATLRSFYDWKGTYKKFDDLIPLITSMSIGVHSREAMSVSCFLDHRIREVLPEILLAELPGDLRDTVVYLKSKWASHEYESYQLLDLVEEKKWLLTLGERSRKMDLDKLGLGMPLVNGLVPLTYQSQRIFTIVQEVTEMPLLDNILPYCALDGHTTPGKAAGTIVWNQLQDQLTPRGIAKDDMKLFIFMNEGCLFKNKLTHDGVVFWDHLSVAWNIARFLQPEIRELFNKVVLPKLQEVREWQMHKNYFSVLSHVAKYK